MNSNVFSIKRVDDHNVIVRWHSEFPGTEDNITSEVPSSKTHAMLMEQYNGRKYFVTFYSTLQHQACETTIGGIDYIGGESLTLEWFCDYHSRSIELFEFIQAETKRIKRDGNSTLNDLKAYVENKLPRLISYNSIRPRLGDFITEYMHKNPGFVAAIIHEELSIK